MDVRSKLPHVGTNIFSVMSGLAKEYNAINLAQGFPNFDAPEALRMLVEKHLHTGKNQYAPMMGVLELREAVRQKIKSQHLIDRSVDSEICITSGASQAIFTAIMALVPRNTEVIVIEPCYDLYEPAITLAGARVISYVMRGPDFKIDWDEIESLISDKTSMIIVNTPHNPTGTILHSDDLDSLNHITKNSNIIVLSDEVYEHLVFDGTKHMSLQGHQKLAERTISVSSFGKTFHCTGWKIGYAVGPQNLMKEFIKVHQFNVFCVPHFIQLGIAEYLQKASTYTGLSSFYQQKRDLFQELMKPSKFIALPSYGSFFQLYEYQHMSDENDLSFVKRITKEKGVAAIPISAFYTKIPEKQYIRFCFAKTEETLVQAAEKLCLL